jgi:hypothetical protein
MLLGFWRLLRKRYKKFTGRKLSAFNELIIKGRLPKIIYSTESKLIFNMQNFYANKISYFCKKVRDAQHFSNLYVGLRLFE